MATVWVALATEATALLVVAGAVVKWIRQPSEDVRGQEVAADRKVPQPA